jgi:hypothetical protein
MAVILSARVSFLPPIVITYPCFAALP